MLARREGRAVWEELLRTGSVEGVEALVQQHPLAFGAES